MMKRSFSRWLILSLFLLILVLGSTACSLFSDESGVPKSNVTSSTSSTSNGSIEHICDDVKYALPCKAGVRRYEEMSDPNAIGYFYEFVPGDRHPLLSFVVQGGIFNVSSLISNPNYQESCQTNGTGACAVVLDKRQPDGTYGTNGDAVYGWRADGVYFEWSGVHQYSREPMAIYEGTKMVGCKHGVPGC